MTAQIVTAPGTVPDFDPDALAAFLRGFLGRGINVLEVRATTGGMSNPTYFVAADTWRAVLRKKPNMALAKSAHAIDREYQVLKALRHSDVPVPEALHYHDDTRVLGTPFYLMEWLNGRVIDTYAAPVLSRAERPAAYRSMCETMARLHRIDIDAVGLSDYGRSGDYFERQIRRWSQLWQEYRKGDDDYPAIDRMIPWLVQRLPTGTAAALCHGDLRIGNFIFHPTEPRVIGLLDWELSTIGHPLADVAFNTQAWGMAPEENGGLAGLDLCELGIPDVEEYLDSYYRLAGSRERMSDFHRVFAMFRGAVGSAGVSVRGEQGNSTLPNSARVGRMLAKAYARQGMIIADRNAI